jgi:hypothetical protein
MGFLISATTTSLAGPALSQEIDLLRGKTLVTANDDANAMSHV